MAIRENGILQPLLVRSLENGSYELIAGERRLRSAIELKMDRVPHSASISTTVEIAKQTNLKGLSGTVNAILRNK